MEVFLEQYAEMQGNVGRISEIFSSHPWLPKRVLALRKFAASDYFQSHMRRGEGAGSAGTPLGEVDREVEEIVKVLG
mgnify:CR=1 FL=1